MSNIYNIYCDESCHLERDQQKAMVLGCVVLPFDLVKTVSDEIKAIKIKHGLHPMTELKWIKVSNNKLQMYHDICRYFIQEDCIRFRAVLVPDKTKLNHKAFDQTQDVFYFKMFYYVLNEVIIKDNLYKIYFDYKDKYENQQIIDLFKYVVSNTKIERESISHQLVHSHESQLIQLTDLLIGAVGYKARLDLTNNAKSNIVHYLEEELKIDINQTTSHFDKFNILRWKAR